jgi:hypothetical protein
MQFIIRKNNRQKSFSRHFIFGMKQNGNESHKSALKAGQNTLNHTWDQISSGCKYSLTTGHNRGTSLWINITMKRKVQQLYKTGKVSNRLYTVIRSLPLSVNRGMELLCNVVLISCNSCWIHQRCVSSNSQLNDRQYRSKQNRYNEQFAKKKSAKHYLLW